MDPSYQLSENSNGFCDTNHLKAHVNDVLVAILKSDKKEMPLKTVAQIFKALCGTDVPFQQLGFKSVKDFLCDNPELYSISTKNADDIWLVISSSSLSHTNNRLIHENCISYDGNKINLNEQTKMKDIPASSPIKCSPRKKKPTNTFLYHKWVPERKNWLKN